MIYVLEHWFLRSNTFEESLRLMQIMDDLVEPGAHENPGWMAHAKCFVSKSDNSRAYMLYPWRDLESHRRLREAEESILRAFVEQHCSKPRQIEYLLDLPVIHED